MKKSYIIPLLIVGVLFVFSCSKNDDKTNAKKPTIILNKPEKETIFNLGDIINFDADFQSDKALNSYKIEIHNASDGHEHEHARALSTSTEKPWSYSEVYKIEGELKSTHVQHDIPIPKEVKGNAIKQGKYHLGVYLIDKAGNQQQSFTNIIIGEVNSHNH